MGDQEQWTPRAHAVRQRRRAVRFMAVSLVAGLVFGLLLGIVAGAAPMNQTERDIFLNYGLLMSTSLIGPIGLAGFIAFAMTPPVTDEDPPIRWWHIALGVAALLALLAVVGAVARVAGAEI